jgi:hypothetical protein
MLVSDLNCLLFFYSLQDASPPWQNLDDDGEEDVIGD